MTPYVAPMSCQDAMTASFYGNSQEDVAHKGAAFHYGLACPPASVKDVLNIRLMTFTGHAPKFATANMTPCLTQGLDVPF